MYHTTCTLAPKILLQEKAWRGASRRSVSLEIKRRATARQEAVRLELAEVLKADSQGLRTRINISFDEWTDRSKRSWLAMNATYCDKSGRMVKRLLTVKALVAVAPSAFAVSGSGYSGSSSSAAASSSSSAAASSDSFY